MSTGGGGADAYDVAVVGAGFGGLSAAAALAAAGRRVLVAERQEGPGGYGHAFHRGPYTFDPAVHVIGQAAPGQFLDVYLRALNVRDHCDFVVLDHAYDIDFPGLRAQLAAGYEPLIDGYARLFPDEAAGLRRFVELCASITRESQQLPPRISMRELDEAAARLPTLFRYRMANLGEVLDDVVSGDRAKAAVTAVWPYLGVPPSKLSVVDFAAALHSIVEPGPAYCRGSFQRLADAFTAAITVNGGEVWCGTTVRRIVTDDGRATGIELEDGTRVAADVVVSNADARQTFADLIGYEQLPPRFVRRLERMSPSLSAFVLFLATTVDVPATGLGHEVFTYRHWNHDETAAAIGRGEPGGVWLSLPTVVDPSLAPPGEHLIICTSLARYDRDWSAERDGFAEALLDRVDGIIPGVRKAVTFREDATPRTLERFTLNQQGAVYGWDHIPSQTVPRRLGHEGPVEGLYLSGHWTHPGGSSFRAIYSGVQTAMLVLGLDHPGKLLERLSASH